MKEGECQVFGVKQLNGLEGRHMLSISKVLTIHGIQQLNSPEGREVLSSWS